MCVHFAADWHVKVSGDYIWGFGQKNLRNVEFLVAMIMDGEGRSDAVPPVWRIAVDLPKPHRRNSVAAALPFPSIDGSAQPENTAADTHLKFDPSIHSISR